MITKHSPNSFQRHVKKQQNQLNCVQKASPYKWPKSTIISNLKYDPESIKIPNSNPKLASVLISDTNPIILSQITNTKILSLNTSKLKQFLSLKVSIEQIFTMEQSQKKKKNEILDLKTSTES